MKFEIAVRPTEDIEKLKLMINSLFPDSKPKITEAKITGTTDGETFWQVVDELKIRPAIEEELEKGHVELSKAAALKGIVNVDLDSSIGAIKLMR